ncbi:NACHT domain-containing protein [Cellulosimicrobium funkei]|uniref:NACHT domain-containing protein n=1 Tax=Cellulosimicrobium funkei TaxID=264251 RepID=UPI00367E9E8C
MAAAETLAASVIAGALADVAARTVARVARAADPLGKSKSKRSRRLQEKLRTLDIFESLQTRDILDVLPNGESLQDLVSALKEPQGKAAIAQIVSARIVEPGGPIPGRAVYSLSLAFSPPNAELAEAVTAVLASAVDRSLASLETIDREAAEDLRQTAGASLVSSTVHAMHTHAETSALYADPERMRVLAIWEQSYRKQMQYQHGHIVPPDFDRKRKVPLADLYVPPKFREVAAGQAGHDDPIDINAFFKQLDRSVLLGDPGGGKSTASAWIATRSAGDNSLHVPFIVTLRDYAREPNMASSIADFIAQQAAAVYQCKPPAGAIEYLLATGRGLVVFDGLDELLDTTRRREMTDRVEAFSNNYPQAPILVTSRRVGYVEASLDPTVFSTYSIAGFNDEDVREYVERWFKHVDDQDGEGLSATCESFLAEASSIRDLTATPLILSLLCIIYRGQGYMPKNRPLVYEKCANLLFERWDSSRQIDVNLRMASQVDNAM